MSTHELKHLISDAPRVMVVDGSKLVRKLISDVLQRELPDVEVVGCAGIEEARTALATLLALLLAWGLNHFFIRSRLVKRFTALNQAVVQIGLGRTDATIPVYGRDELGRIAGLLRHTLGQLSAQKNQLEQEEQQ